MFFVLKILENFVLYLLLEVLVNLRVPVVMVTFEKSFEFLNEKREKIFVFHFLEEKGRDFALILFIEKPFNIVVYTIQ